MSWHRELTVRDVPEGLRKAYREARKAKWSIKRTASNHIQWRSPSGKVVHTANSPGGGNRSVSNSLSQLRRAGLDVLA